MRHLKLAEAVHLAVEQNRTLKIARLKVQENEHPGNRPPFRVGFVAIPGFVVSRLCLPMRT